ncbi:stathmin-like isoform X4 [Gigantopelta aegis]|uniref:stathmin-like isoform X4 n=1 Tax=Gigantopelta aegis TaxID=1735272 RepID=UPI001B88D3E1|nr:stathmin-like isoform X4 [Gigantopelta aegis]
MSSVCNWLSLFVCLRDSPKKPKHRIHPNHRGHYDAVVMWKGKEAAKQKTGGVAYEVILKPATTELDAARVLSPPKGKVLTQDDIVMKLQKAEERRLSYEQMKLERIAQEREKAQAKIAKIQAESETFSKITQEKLRRSMEISKEKRDMQIKALQERLREHASHIKEVCEASKNMNKMSEEKILQKMETALKNREGQLKALQERLLEHIFDVNSRTKNSLCSNLLRLHQHAILPVGQ